MVETLMVLQLFVGIGTFAIVLIVALYAFTSSRDISKSLQEISRSLREASEERRHLLESIRETLETAQQTRDMVFRQMQTQGRS